MISSSSGFSITQNSNHNFSSPDGVDPTHLSIERNSNERKRKFSISPVAPNKRANTSTKKFSMEISHVLNITEQPSGSLEKGDGSNSNSIFRYPALPTLPSTPELIRSELRSFNYNLLELYIPEIQKHLEYFTTSDEVSIPFDSPSQVNNFVLQKQLPSCNTWSSAGSPYQVENSQFGEAFAAIMTRQEAEGLRD